MAGMGHHGPVGFPGAPGSPDNSLPDAGLPGEGVRRGTAASGPSRGASKEGGPRGGVSRKDTLGSSIHEVGTARMSVNPQDGVLNSFCRTHEIPNLYVFGGNAFPSTGDKHPTLTMMALTARGCDHLLEQVKT